MSIIAYHGENSPFYKSKIFEDVDIGVNSPTVTSTGTFWIGNDFDHWRREYEQQRGDLQQCGTQWAHQNIHTVDRKEEGRYKMIRHGISNDQL